MQVSVLHEGQDDHGNGEATFSPAAEAHPWETRESQEVGTSSSKDSWGLPQALAAGFHLYPWHCYLFYHSTFPSAWGLPMPAVPCSGCTFSVPPPPTRAILSSAPYSQISDRPSLTTCLLTGYPNFSPPCCPLTLVEHIFSPILYLPPPNGLTNKLGHVWMVKLLHASCFPEELFYVA